MTVEYIQANDNPIKKFPLPQPGITLAVLLLLAFPSAVQANPGSPLLLVGVFHLFIGNLIIGLMEGFLLAKVFRLSTFRCICLMIAANYFSAWLGGLVIARGLAHTLPMNLYNAGLIHWLMVVFTYVIALVLEFPFIARAFRGDPSWKRKSINGSFLVQTVSYVILFGWFWSLSSISLYTDTNVVAISSISLPDKVLIYFISSDDGDVYAGSLRDRQWHRVFDLNSTRESDRLIVRPASQDTDSWDLFAQLDSGDFRNPNFVTVKEQFAFTAVPSSEAPLINWGDVPKLGDAKSISWSFRTGFFTYEGLMGSNPANPAKRFLFSFETPFAEWPVRNAVHLPSDKVLLQLGENQICVYDPVKNQIALVTRGRGPIAVMEE